uniref:Uncharacterized protein n=1 Tax=Timema bartmani TaxID=61472 RepID=A0A7R9FF18_9NEOP|nr:unnamed protein product [Timema bartmani]
MTLSYKPHHSGTKQGSSLTLTDCTMTLSYKLHHRGTKQGSSLTLTDYTMTLSYKLHHSGTKKSKLAAFQEVGLAALRFGQYTQEHDIAYYTYIRGVHRLLNTNRDIK